MVTLSICGIFKEVMTISAAAYFFNDPLTPLNISGLVVTIISIGAYNYIKVSRMREEALRSEHAHAHPHHHRPIRDSSNPRAHSNGYAAFDAEEFDDEEGHFGGVRPKRNVVMDAHVSAAAASSAASTLNGAETAVSLAQPRASFSHRGSTERR